MDLTTPALLGKRIRNVGRLAQITNVFAKHGLWSLIEGIGLKSWLTPAQVREAEDLSRSEGTDSDDHSTENPDEIKGMPARLRRAFEELGPAFVKLGQVLATREDLLPAPFIEELKKLHSGVQQLDFATVEAVLKAELSPESLAALGEIDKTPLAAGSVAQVHRATLATGEEVVLKIQRPGINLTIETDLALMEFMAGLADRYMPESKSMRLGIIIEEFARGTRGELDFVREGGTTQKIAENFAGISYVKIPKVYWDHSTPHVLVQEFLDGYSIYDTKTLEESGIDIVQFVERGLSAFMQMVFVDGFYHGDLHPGNLIVMRDGRVGFIDFGVGVLIGRMARERLAGLLMSLVEEDYDTMVAHFIDLSDPGPEFNIEAFTHEVSNALAPFVGLKLAAISSGRLLWELARIAGKHGTPMPRELILFLRTLVAFEGVGSKLDPNFDIISTCEKFTSQLVGQLYSPENLKKQGLMIARDFANLGRYAPRQLKGILKAVLDGDLHLNIASPEAKGLTESLDRASARMAAALVASALIIGSAIMIFARVGEEFHDMSLIGVIELAFAVLIICYLSWSVIRSGLSR